MREKSFRHLSKQDPVLARVIKSAKLRPLKPRKNHFKSLVVAIINQQLSTKAAETIEARFVSLFGGSFHKFRGRSGPSWGEGKFPKPAEILKVSNKKLRACGLSLRKISYIKYLAKAVEQKKIDFKKLQKATDEEIINTLTRFKGIGRWTAEMFLIFHLLRPDVLPLKDLGLLKSIDLHYTDGKRLKTSEYAALSERWAPYRTVATWYLWRALDPVPVEY